MPQDKNTRARHTILDGLFRNQELTIDELLEKVNDELELKGLQPISLRTLKNDINTFERDYEADFASGKKCGKKRLYCYQDKEFYAIKSRELSDGEKTIIKSGISIMEGIESLPGNISFERIKLELCELVNYNSENAPVVYYENNPYLRGLDKWWKPLYDAIKSKTVLKIKYRDFTDKEFIFYVSPYALKEYNHRWYLICWNNEKRSHYYNIALDRMEAVERLEDETYIEDVSDIEEYYEQAVGITVMKNEPIEKVVFIVSGLTAKYIDSKPLHPLAKQKWLPDGTLQVTLNVVINYELEHLLLSYADSIKILSPQRLIDRHKELLKNALEKYK
jgi:predicted DNA-binding transcriptional regulator YafY